MRASRALLLVIVVLATAAGCANAVGSASVGQSASAPAIPDCRNSGAYNRAANLCVSNGP
jgi:hypothetical protein